MKKLLTYVSLLLLTISCNTNQHMSASDNGVINLESPAAKSNVAIPATMPASQQMNVVKENNVNAAKPVVLKRVMRRPAVI